MNPWLVGWLIGCSVCHKFKKKGGKLHFHATIRALAQFLTITEKLNFSIKRTASFWKPGSNVFSFRHFVTRISFFELFTLKFLVSLSFNDLFNNVMSEYVHCCCVPVCRASTACGPSTRTGCTPPGLLTTTRPSSSHV